MQKRHLLRAALRLHEVFQTRAAQEVAQELNLHHGSLRKSLEQVPQMLLTGSPSAAPASDFALRRQLRTLVMPVEQAVDRLLQTWPAVRAQLPSVRDLLADLHQLEEEFVELKVDLARNTLAVTTEAIELEGIFLGSFAITLAWQRLAQGDTKQGLTIVALDPQPASSDEDVTHPHVKNGTLCAGEATTALQRALQQGRLVDAFFLIRSVLTHYNARSPYVPLDTWQGEACYDCGCYLDSDDLWYCQECGHDHCSACTGSCATCLEVRCQGCLEYCRQCRGYFCSSCLAPVVVRGTAICQKCQEAATPPDPIDVEQAASPEDSTPVIQTSPEPTGAPL